MCMCVCVCGGGGGGGVVCKAGKGAMTRYNYDNYYELMYDAFKLTPRLA